ncbi:hypothetical protein ACFLTD_01480 [Elusimicrobiota bacterium]
MYVGIIIFVQKLGSAVVIWLIGIILSWSGYAPGTVQSTRSMWCIRLIFTEGTAFFILLVIIISFLYPMTREKHQALINAIARKKSNEDYDTAMIWNIVE